MRVSKKDPLPQAEQEENAALAALGLLPTRDLAETPAALVEGMKEAASLLADTLAPVSPAPSLKSRVIERVAQYEAMKPIADVRRYDDNWVHTGIPGIDLKTLFKDKKSGRTTLLLRMEPGASFPAHRHGDDEQCLVVQGDVRWGELVYEQGDFVVMGSETTHPSISSVNGNILLLVMGRNEMIHS